MDSRHRRRRGCPRLAAPAGGGEKQSTAAFADRRKPSDSAASSASRASTTAPTIVANAAIAHRVKLADLTDEKWDHTLDIDLKGL